MDTGGESVGTRGESVESVGTRGESIVGIRLAAIIQIQIFIVPKKVMRRQNVANK